MPPSSPSAAASCGDSHCVTALATCSPGRKSALLSSFFSKIVMAIFEDLQLGKRDGRKARGKDGPHPQYTLHAGMQTHWLWFPYPNSQIL